MKNSTVVENQRSTHGALFLKNWHSKKIRYGGGNKKLFSFTSGFLLYDVIFNFITHVYRTTSLDIFDFCRFLDETVQGYTFTP